MPGKFWCCFGIGGLGWDWTLLISASRELVLDFGATLTRCAFGEAPVALFFDFVGITPSLFTMIMDRYREAKRVPANV